MHPQNDASVAQLVEHLTLNQGVQGSTPCGSTRKPLIFQWLFSLSLLKVGVELFPIFAVSSFCNMRYRFLLCLVLSFALFVAGTSLWAQIPTGYYNNAVGKQGDELKTALHDIIKGHNVVSYGGLLDAFAYTDCKPNGKIWDIYSNIEYSLNTGLCGDFEQEGDCWNREHTWPQSWFNESNTPRCDLFQVYPTDGFVNSQRSSFPYGEVSSPTYTSGNGSKLGPCVTTGYTGTVFEPIDEYKGDIARGYFYMSVRYSGEDDDWVSSGMTNKSEIKPWALTMLLRWSDEDPVSQKEIDRNNAVYGYQNNRNPFIDHPEYARMIWDENWHGNDDGDFVKVTSAPADWSGEYILVYEQSATTAYVWTGEDAANGYVSKPISNDTITDDGFVTVTIAPMTGGYSVQVNGGDNAGKYLSGTSGSNKLSFVTSPVVNTFSFESNSVKMVSNTSVMRFNNNTGQNRFRYFKSDTYSNQQPIQLYKRYIPEYRYYLVTDASQLVAGRTYLIVNTTDGKALGKNQNTDNRSAEDVVINNDVIAGVSNDVCELTLGSDGGYWTFFDANWNTNGGYLYAAGSSANQLKTQATNNARGKWSVSFYNGVATIKPQSGNTRIKYNPNNGTPIFSCYVSGQQDVKLFVRSEEYEYQENTTLACLNTFDKHTVCPGVVLTANKVLGTVLFNDPSNLVINDGAQFIHNANGVMATVKKNIEGYAGDEGWYTIAAPMTSVAPDESNLTDGDYDLYAYQENAELEWKNYKVQPFVMSPGLGYLYACNSDVTLCMSGILYNGSSSETIDLSYESSVGNLRGFNLLGNLTAHDIVFTKSDNVSDGYYYLDNSSTWIYTIENNVPVGRGFLVKANAMGQTVTLNPQGRSEYGIENHYLCLSVGGEKVYVGLVEGVSMPLMGLDGHHAPLYLTQGQEPFAMLVRNGAETIDLSYEVRNDGLQTLTADTHGLELEYLHLVDLVTGDDVDLLVTPNYSFMAKTTDPFSRFKLVFNAKGNDGLIGK